MIAVIFRATIAQFDDDYFRTALKLKELAMNKYGCLDFISVTDGNQEIAISYWENEQQIRDWKKDPVHKLAQQAGASKWYASYSVDICKINRAYKRP